MKTLTIHHSADFDGLASREVCLYWLRKIHPEGEHTAIGWDYGQSVPAELIGHVAFDQIYMVDITVDAVLGDDNLRKHLILIDHHASVLQKWGDPLPFAGLFVVGVAACRLCWAWFTAQDAELASVVHDPEWYRQRQVKEPRILTLLGEWDVFNTHDRNTIPLQLGLKACTEAQVATIMQNEFDREDHDLSDAVCEVLEAGDVIRRFVESEYARNARANSYSISWEGLRFCCLNTGRPGNSLMFEDAYDGMHDALLAWRWDGKQFYVSLYHRPGREDLDLSLIAVKHGGGGHRGACGFRCNAEKARTIGIIA